MTNFRKRIESKYQIVSKDEIVPSIPNFAKGKWFKGQFNRPGYGVYPIPRVKFVGVENKIYEFQKEDGHVIKIPEKEMFEQRYAFFEDKDQSENLTGYTPPDYSKLPNRPFSQDREGFYTLDSKSAVDDHHGTHIAFVLTSPEGEDETHKLMAFQRVCKSLKSLGDKATENADFLWKNYGVKVKLGKKLLSVLPINVEGSIPSNFREMVEAKYKIIEKLKSWTKSFLKKMVTALVLTGMFAGIGAGTALAKGSAEKKTQQFAAYLEKLAHKEGKTQLKFIAKSEKSGNTYILHLKIENKETGGSCSLSVKDPTKVQGLQSEGNDELANSWCQDLTDMFTEVAIKTMNE